MKKKNFDKPSSRRRDQYTVVLEDIRSNIKAFGEGQDFMRSDIGQLKTDVQSLKTDMDIVKGELALIRYNQVTRDEFKLLETRVLHLEKSRK